MLAQCKLDARELQGWHSSCQKPLMAFKPWVTKPFHGFHATEELLPLGARERGVCVLPTVLGVGSSVGVTYRASGAQWCAWCEARADTCPGGGRGLLGPESPW